MLLGQLVAHRCSNEGIGVVMQKDTDSTTVQFENGEVVTSTPDLIIELTAQEVWGVRLDANNVRITNERIKELRVSEAKARELGDFLTVMHVRKEIRGLKKMVKKDYNFLKNTFGIDYKIEE